MPLGSSSVKGSIKEGEILVEVMEVELQAEVQPLGPRAVEPTSKNLSK